MTCASRSNSIFGTNQTRIPDHMKRLFIIPFLLFAVLTPVFAQNMDVTFRFNASENALRAYLPGSFNNWGNNNSGTIPIADGSLMVRDTDHGFWYKTINLAVGGGTSTHLGRRGYTYKFHEQYNAAGTNWNWFTDPLNPIVIGGNADSFIEVTVPLVFQLQPSNNAVVQDTPPAIWATVASTSDDPIDPAASSVTINGEVNTSMDGYYDDSRQLLYIPSTDLLGATLRSGTNTVRVNAVTESGATRFAETTFSYIAGPQVVREARPSGIEDGVTVHTNAPGTVSFSLFAPGKDYVYIIGDHSNWEIQDEFLMKLHEVRSDSAHFWLTIDGLENGTYRFQYLVDGELRMPDLFTEMVLDPDLDRFITSSVYPNMPQYPAGQTTGMVGVFEVGRTPYQWQIPDFERPAQHQLVIYELLLRDFVTNSTFEVLRDTLNYLERLGVNAIELMPVSNFDGNDSWGYNPNFHGALDKSYGTRESFKQFVDEAHSRGIAVILDVVYNHAQDKSPLVQLYGPNRANNPFLGPAHAYNVFFHLNHDNNYIRYWLDRMNRYWLETYNIDGYRFDLTKGFASNVNNQSLLDGYNAPRIANLKRMFDRIRAFDETAYVILEHFAANTEERELAEYRLNEGVNGMMLWGNMNHTYNEATMGYFNNVNFSNGYFGSRGWAVPNLITYMESHDEQWMMFKNLKFGACAVAPNGGAGCNAITGEYNVRRLSTALDRQKLAGAFFFTIPGPKMMWQFGELGYGGEAGECLKPGGSGDGDCLSTDPGRTGRKPVRWEYREDADRYDLYETWAAMIHLRRNYAVFNDPQTQVTFNNTGAVKSIRLTHPEMDATIVGNFSMLVQNSSVVFARAGQTWYDFFSGNSLEVNGTSANLRLEPGEFRIYTSEPLPTPGGPPVSIVDEMDDLPAHFRLYQNYPNPFNPTTTIQYDVAEAGLVSISVFDILGREVAQLVNSDHIAGTYRVQFMADQLSSGTYLIRMNAGGRVMTIKTLLMK